MSVKVLGGLVVWNTWRVLFSGEGWVVESGSSYNQERNNCPWASWDFRGDKSLTEPLWVCYSSSFTKWRPELPVYGGVQNKRRFCDKHRLLGKLLSSSGHQVRKSTGVSSVCGRRGCCLEPLTGARDRSWHRPLGLSSQVLRHYSPCPSGTYMKDSPAQITSLF